MIRRMTLGATALSLLLANTALAGGMPEEDPITPATASAERESLSEAGASVELRVRSGEAQFVRVSRGHMNRIVTPFPEFDLWTESDEEIQTSGPVFYVSPASDRPISLFITPTGREDLAISLTLVPSAVPPTMITLKLENAAGALVHPAAVGSATANPVTAGIGAGTYEPAAPPPALPNYESGPYEETIAAALVAFASGAVPSGFAPGSLTAMHPRCRRIGGLPADFSRGQRYVGAAFEVFVGLVRNTGSLPLDFDERRCEDPSVAAVALWPAGSIAPGGRAEIFVVRRRASASGMPVSARARPSLLAGN
ncbi:MAG: type-F conjugative transfer system secretin TraK [Pseudomonadota bacterium]